MFLFSRIVQQDPLVVVSGLPLWPGPTVPTASEAQLASDHVWSPRSSLPAVHPAMTIGRSWCTRREIMEIYGDHGGHGWKSGEMGKMGTSETWWDQFWVFFLGDMSYKRTYCSHITSYNLLVIERFHQGNSRGGWSILQWLLMIFQVGTFHQ